MSLDRAYAAEFAEFERHKNTLLDHLRSAYELGPKSKPFDEGDLWHHLIGAAGWVFNRPKVRQRTVLPAQRKERLRDLAKVLARARHEADKAMRDDVGWDLLGGWSALANTSPVVRKSDGLSALVSLDRIDEFKKLVAGLVALEDAANRAAGSVRTRRGPTSGGGILPPEDMNALMAVYRRTDQEPHLGPGLFAQFVEEFLIATGRSDNIAQDYVVEAFRYALRRERRPKNPAKKRPKRKNRGA